MDKLLSIIFEALDQLKRIQISIDFDQANDLQSIYSDQALETQKNRVLEKFENLKIQTTPEQKIEIIDYTVRIDNDWFFAHLHNIDWITDENYRFSNSTFSVNTKPIIFHAIAHKACKVINYIESKPALLKNVDFHDLIRDFVFYYPHHPWSLRLIVQHIKNPKIFADIISKVMCGTWKATADKLSAYRFIVAFSSQFVDAKSLNQKNYLGPKLLEEYILLPSIHDNEALGLGIGFFIKNGAKLSDRMITNTKRNITALAYCEEKLPRRLLDEINQIQFEYAHNSRWQKLLDMGALTKDVDLYIYNLVSQNPELIVENQILKTLFCQILSQENRPHIDSIWEAYHSNIVQHPLIYVIENFLSKKPSKLTPHNAPETNIMEDPLSFTTGYCHYLGKDVLFILDNNLDERKSLLTTKLYQSEIKPYLLPPSINHSLFSQLCQNKNASDLGQHRFDQRYGVTVIPNRHN